MMTRSKVCIDDMAVSHDDREMAFSENRFIAILDDDKAVRTALLRLLETTNYRVKAYSSAEEFLSDIAGEKPGCIVVDYQMPDMTGLDLRLYLEDVGIDIPMIMITAHDEANIRERCVEAGVHAFLVKPIFGAMLLMTIEHVLGAGASRACG